MRTSINFVTTVWLLFFSLNSFATEYSFQQLSPQLPINGAGTIHGDNKSTDTTFLRGPGKGPLSVISSNPSPLYGTPAVCPTLLVRSDFNVMALCTAYTGVPVAKIFAADGSRSLGELQITTGNLLGGVYAYLDKLDRLVLVDGTHNLVAIAYDQHLGLSIDSSIPLADAVTGHCGGHISCDGVVSISPSKRHHTWFATQRSVIGVVNKRNGTIGTIQLAPDEFIANSFSTTRNNFASVVTNKALYLLKAERVRIGNKWTMQPVIRWRHEYDAGLGRKPGQLSHGSGATPTFFGPRHHGTKYVMITDNAFPLTSLIVRRKGRGGELVCQVPLFNASSSGTENSAIGAQNTIIVSSTYGYPYPQLPSNAGPSIPENAAFFGGMMRIDINEAAGGCDVVWENTLASAAVPKLSTQDNLVYTVERVGSPMPAATDTFDFVALDVDTGYVVNRQSINSPYLPAYLSDTLQTAGNISANYKVYWQGTVGGFARISPLVTP